MKRDTTIQFTQAIDAWGSADFKPQLQAEIEQHNATQLPLQNCLTYSSVALDEGLKAMILNIEEQAHTITVKAAIFFKGVIAGCSCADDPTPVDTVDEYCELLFKIDKQSGCADVTLINS